jgi:diguanylate cyclase (GGDEF)-like protein
MNNGLLSTIILIAIIGNLALMSIILLPLIRRQRAARSSIPSAAPIEHSSAPLTLPPDPDPESQDIAAFDDPADVEVVATEEPSQPPDAGDQEPDMDRKDNEPARPPRWAPPSEDDRAADAIEAFLSDVRQASTEADPAGPDLAPAADDGRTSLSDGWPRPRDRGPDPAALADPVTGLDGPAAWSHAVAQEASRSSRYGRPVAVVIAELDGLSRIEERFGSAAADRLIPPVADVLRRSARSADTIARLDRVRFGLLLPETDEIQAINLVERIRAGCDRWLAAGAVAVRLSIGWASPPLGGDLGDALRQAEERMRREQRRPAA